MTKENFIDFIKDLGFGQTWTSDSDSFSLSTDVVGNPNQNIMAFSDQLNITIVEDRVQLSLSQLSTHMSVGKNFGSFILNTFGDKDDLQLEIFLSFIISSFNKKPDGIIRYMRDKKIENILK